MSIKMSSTMSWKQIRTLAILFLGNLMGQCALSILLPLFPHETQKRQLPLVLSGAVFSTFSVAVIVSCPIAAYVTPLLGGRNMYVFGIVMAGSATTIFGALPNIDDNSLFIGACCFVRAVEGMAVAFVRTGANTIIAQTFSGSNLNTAVGVVLGAYGVGFCFAPPIAGLLYDTGGYGLPFYILGASMFVVAVSCWLVLPSNQDNIAEQKDDNKRSAWRLFFKSPDNAFNCILLIVMEATWESSFTTLEPYANKVLGLSLSQVTIYFLTAMGWDGIMSAVFGKLSDRYSNTYIQSSISLAVLSIGFMLLGPSPLLGLKPTWWMTGVGFTLTAISFAGASVPVFGKLMETTVNILGLPNDTATQSFIGSVNTFCYFFGSSVGPPIAGHLVDLYGFRIMTTIVACIILILSIITAIWSFRYDRLIKNNYFIKEEKRPLLNNGTCVKEQKQSSLNNKNFLKKEKRQMLNNNDPSSSSIIIV